MYDTGLKSVSINMLPLTSNTFRLDDDIYVSDNMAETHSAENYVSSALKFDLPRKLEQCVILFCRKGHISLTVNQKEFKVNSNSVFLTMSGSIIEKVEADEASEIILLVFNMHTLHDFIDAKVSSEFMAAGYKIQEAVLMMTSQSMENFVSFYKSVRNMLVNETDKRRQVNILNGCAYIVMNILGGLVTGHDNKQKTRSSRYQQIVSSFMSDIHQYVLKERNIDFYSSRASLSKKHFSRIIIMQTGKRPVEHIREYLSIEAKCLLATEKYSIKQISEMLNFTNTSSFTRFFHSVTGKTPKTYLLEIH